MDQERTVLFVCEHGSAKSVVAAAYFNRLATERQIGLRADSRGTNPDEAVAPNAARGLAVDGFAPDGEAPRRLSNSDVEAAARVVAFCPLPDGYGGSDAIEVWEGVPPVEDGPEHIGEAGEREAGLRLHPARGENPEAARCVP